MSGRPTDTFDRIAGQLKQRLVDQIPEESAEDLTIAAALTAIADELARLNQFVSVLVDEPMPAAPLLVECERCAGEGKLGGIVPCEPCKGTGKVEAA